MICRYLLAPSRLIRYRSFDYSKLTCWLFVSFRPAYSLIRYDGRGRFRRRHLIGSIFDIPGACGLTSLSSSVRYGRRGDEVLGVFICGRHR